MTTFYALTCILIFLTIELFPSLNRILPNMLDLDDYETEYLSKKEQRIRGPQAVYSANLMGLSNLKPLEYILFEHNVFCKYTEHSTHVHISQMI